MIRTEEKAPDWVKDFAISLIKNNNEEIGVRFIKADTIIPVARLHINNRTDYKDVIHLHPYSGRSVIGRMPTQSRRDVRIAYKDEYAGFDLYEVDNILHTKPWERIGLVELTSNHDNGHDDTRYHIFRVSDLEVFFRDTNGKKDTVALFRDIDSKREFVVKGDQVKLNG